MIYMKKITTILFSILLTTALFAQGEMGGFGMHVGFASPTLRLNSPSNTKKLDSTPLRGIKVGLSYDATIVKGFGTTIGLNYTFGTYRSGWVDDPVYPGLRQTSYRDTYQGLELFTDWQYKFEIAGETYLMLYTGPTIQVHLSLKEQEYVRTASGIESHQTSFGYIYDDVNAFNDYKRLNVTWGVGAGFQYKQFFLRGGYDFGLINPYKSDQFAETEQGFPKTAGRFDQWQIKIGLYFWRQ